MCSKPIATNVRCSSINIISQDELQIANTDSIGGGVFGNCYLKKFTRLSKNVVEKQLIDGNIDVLYKEAQYMQMFSHRCIPHLFGIQVEKNPLSLVMEFVGENSQSMTVHKLLFDSNAAKIRSSMSLKDWLCVCYDITDALDYMHQKGYLHCDLKTDNVLVSKRKGYLIDFGKVREMAHPTAKKYKVLHGHIAPEVLKGSHVNSASDVYSLGIIFKTIAKEINSKVLSQLGKTATNIDPKQRPTLLKLLTTLHSENIHD